jgi:ABC-type phosphate/phosphonate transport system substrate-binding protein
VIAVGTARADIAAIDAVSYAALARFEPDLVARLRFIASSPDSPTLPFVTAATTSDDMVRKVRTALGRAIADPALADVCATLFLTGVVPADADALTPIVALETAAVGAGHAALA